LTAGLYRHGGIAERRAEPALANCGLGPVPPALTIYWWKVLEEEPGDP